MVDFVKTGEELPAAVIKFLSGWQTIQEGNISRGRKLAIEYNPERLPRCRQEFRGAIFGEIEVYIRFHPGGQYYTGGVIEKILASEQGFVIGLQTGRYEVTVPMDAAQIELWFRGFYQTTSFYEEWDSQHGHNYWFQVVG